MNTPRQRRIAFDSRHRWRIRGVRLAVLAGLLMGATASSAATYWIDSSKTSAAGCGTSAANACRDYAHLMGSAGCPGACGCDANGCADNISNDAAPVSVHFVSGGSWVGDGNGHPICYSFPRTASSELTFDCATTTGSYAPRQCSITGAGLGLSGLQAVVIAGSVIGSCDGAAIASYTKWMGFNISVPAGTSGWRAKGAGHLLLADSLIDGGTVATNDMVIYGDNIPYVSFVNNTITNCGTNPSYGCLGNERNDHQAVIGNNIGPIRGFPIDRNSDGITVQNADTVLIDGNVVHGTPDGIDVGMLDANPLRNIIIRYNDTYDFAGDVSAGADNHIVYSGDYPTNANTGSAVVYKNVLRFTNPLYFVGGWRTKEGSKDVDFWFNTTFGSNYNVGDQNNTFLANLGLNNGQQSPSANMPVLYNIFDATSIQNRDIPKVCSLTDGPACPMSMAVPSCSSSSCAFIGNGLWFGERGPSAGCLLWHMSDMSPATFNCDLTRRGGGGDLNSIGVNSGNFRADPHFVNRGGATLASYALTAASTAYIDKGGSFCRASGAGNGNTINVTCSGASTSPQHFFPQPSNYYAVQNGDCAGKGTRAAEANGGSIGCYDIQIDGCGGGGGLGNLPGVRTITSMTATSITFAGAACSWASSAKVHVPWSGNAPDVGALESSSSTTLQAPTLLDVQPIS